MDQENNSQISPREIFEFLWRLKWWIVGAMIAAGLIGFFFARSQTPAYERESWIMLNKNDGSNADLALLATMSGRTVQKKVDNEIFILKSPSLMRKVVEKYELNKRYYQYGAPVANRFSLVRRLMDFKAREFYRDSPFLATLEQDSLALEHNVSIPSFSIEFKNRKAVDFTIRKVTVGGKKLDLEKTRYRYGEPVDLGKVKVYFTVTDAEAMSDDRDRYLFTYSQPFSCAKGFIKNLEVLSNGKSYNQTDVVTLKITDAISRRAEDVLNGLVFETNQEARDYANMASVNTVKFIDTRLSELAMELGNAESDYKRYQSNNIVLNLESQSQMAMTSDMTYQNQLVDVRLQLKVLDMITNYLNETPEGEYRVIPTNIGISDVGLNSIISSYNEMVAERNRMVANSSESNPRVISLNSELNDGRKSIDISIANLVNVYKLREKDLVKTLSDSKSKMASIPQQQFEVQQLSRKINIIEPLYLMLQEKREEAQITMYSQSDNFRVIEAAFGPGNPVSPKTMQIILIALVLGFCIPPALVWLRIQLKTKVETKADIAAKVSAPVLAVLPKAPDDFTGIIQKNGRDTTSESFRMLRSNLQYLPDCKVIQITSSTPGEGKSYISSNLAVSIAHVGKKVLLIGMDIRKPVFSKIFKTTISNKNNTVVGYLIGKCTDLDSLVTESGVSSHLDLIFAGPVPPNPTDLLSQGKEAEIINYFKDKYDYVIIDSAPYLPVSDSQIINQYVDVTLYTVRANYTDLKMLTDINEALTSTVHPMKNPQIVLNDLDVVASKYRYGYGAGYGYGYGYGHGYGYGYGYGYGNESENLSKKQKAAAKVKDTLKDLKEKLEKHDETPEA